MSVSENPGARGKKTAVRVGAVGLGVAVLIGGIVFFTRMTGPSGPEVPSSNPDVVETTPAPEARGVIDVDGDGIIRVGFSQVGAESGWRTANTQSFQDYFVEANGFELVFIDANEKADKQTADVRELISLGVEVIVIAPVSATGWAPVLEEAQAARIPVINADRKFDCPEDLYLFFFGGNMEQQGINAVNWLTKNVTTVKGLGLTMEDVKIAHLQGMLGSTAQMGRSKALADAIDSGNGWTIVYQSTGEYNKEKGIIAFESMFAVDGGRNFNVIWGENDDMVYGALDALSDAGLSADGYVIVSFDGNCSAVQMVKEGIIDVIAECTPLFADQIGELIKRVDAGETVGKVQYTVEGFIDATNIDAKLPVCFGS